MGAPSLEKTHFNKTIKSINLKIDLKFSPGAEPP